MRLNRELPISRVVPKPEKPTFLAPPSSKPAEFVRLKTWLNHMAENNPPEPIAYSALLQVWLAASGIEWPEDVFTRDYARKGSGQKPGKTHYTGHAIAERLAETQDPNWTELGREFFQRTEDDARKAAHAARLAYRTFMDSRRRCEISDREIADSAYSMLGWEWDEDILDREIGPDRER